MEQREQQYKFNTILGRVLNTFSLMLVRSLGIVSDKHNNRTYLHVRYYVALLPTAGKGEAPFTPADVPALLSVFN